MKRLVAALSRVLDRSTWRGIETAPFNRELELATIGEQINVLGTCIRRRDDWLDAQTLRPTKVSATHWRFRWPVIFPVSCC